MISPLMGQVNAEMKHEKKSPRNGMEEGVDSGTNVTCSR